MNFKGQKCPVCQNTFEDYDDVVVCPDCGTPHHKRCYRECGECFNKNNHGTGWAWKKSDNIDSKENTKVCSRCKFKNYSSALFCESCGQSLIDLENKQSTNPNFSYNELQSSFNITYSDDEIINGVTEKELAQFIKVNAPYYIEVARKIKKTGRSRFNFSAFLFMGNWLILRKKYIWGIILSLLSFAMWMMFVFITNVQIIKINEFAGLNTDSLSMSEFILKSNEYINSLSIEKQLFFMLPFVFVVILLIEMLLFGLLSNRIYLNSCAKKIRNIKNLDKSKDEMETLFTTNGGVNLKLAVYTFTLITIAMQIVKFIL